MAVSELQARLAQTDRWLGLPVVLSPRVVEPDHQVVSIDQRRVVLAQVRHSVSKLPNRMAGAWPYRSAIQPVLCWPQHRPLCRCAYASRAPETRGAPVAAAKTERHFAFATSERSFQSPAVAEHRFGHRKGQSTAGPRVGAPEGLRRGLRLTGGVSTRKDTNLIISGSCALVGVGTPAAARADLRPIAPPPCSGFALL